jgi:hypothetical protein
MAGGFFRPGAFGRLFFDDFSAEWGAWQGMGAFAFLGVCKAIRSCRVVVVNRLFDQV